MVEIAKALATAGASVLVMDEPTSALTSREVDQLFALIARLIARGVAIVYITHRLDEVYRIGHRVTVLRDGRHVGDARCRTSTVAELVRLMANRDVGEHFPKRRASAGRRAARVEGLGTRRRAAATSPSPARRRSASGSPACWARVAASWRACSAGADRADAGRIRATASRVDLRTPRRRDRHGIGFLPEDRKAQGLVPAAPSRDNIALPHGRQLAPCGLPAAPVRRALAEPMVTESARQSARRAAVRLLSGGNQQKVVLGKWLAGDARCLHLRRADARRRRRREGRDLQPDEPADRRGRRHHHDLVGAAGAAGDERSHPRDARRPHRRRVRRGRGDAGTRPDAALGLDLQSRLRLDTRASFGTLLGLLGLCWCCGP